MSNRKDLDNKIDEALSFLLSCKAISKQGDSWVFTDGAQSRLELLSISPNLAPAVITPNGLPTKTVDWEMKFINFIRESEVPRRLEDNKGGEYDANKYSEPAMKVFRKALESGTVYEVLVATVKLYYKGRGKFKKKIGNYFIDGDWKTDYLAMLDSFKNGTLETHVKKEVDNDTGQWTIG